MHPQDMPLWVVAEYRCDSKQVITCVLMVKDKKNGQFASGFRQEILEVAILIPIWTSEPFVTVE